jgi:hypothetical protein
VTPPEEAKDVTCSPNFMLSEFQGDKDKYKVKREDIDDGLLNHLELMRFIGGDIPLVIEDGGGYRSNKYNDDVGGGQELYPQVRQGR